MNRRELGLGVFASGLVAGATEAATGPRSAGASPGLEGFAPSSSIRQAVSFNAPPARIYQVLLDAKDFARFTGYPAPELDPHPGGALSLFGGQITGRNIELVADRRIVQAWRDADWAEGLYSLVRFDLAPAGQGTQLVLAHWGFPSADRSHLDPGWRRMYWKPLAAYLG